jgi:hypothetical protein
MLDCGEWRAWELAMLNIRVLHHVTTSVLQYSFIRTSMLIPSKLAVSKFCWCHVLYAVERKIDFVHRISISCLRWRENLYGNWRPQFVPAPELFTSLQETRVKISKQEQWNCFVFTVARVSNGTCHASEVYCNSYLEPWARKVDGWFICCWKLIFTMQKW